MNKNLRSKTVEFSFTELKKDKLPTSADVLQKILLEKSKSSKPNLKEIFKLVAIEIEEIWNQIYYFTSTNQSAD